MREDDEVGQQAIGLELHGIERNAIAVALWLGAERAAGVVAETHQAQPDELREGQGQQGEIVAGDPQIEAGIADHQPGHDGVSMATGMPISGEMPAKFHNSTVT